MFVQLHWDFMIILLFFNDDINNSCVYMWHIINYVTELFSLFLVWFYIGLRLYENCHDQFWLKNMIIKSIVHMQFFFSSDGLCTWSISTTATITLTTKEKEEVKFTQPRSKRNSFKALSFRNWLKKKVFVQQERNCYKILKKQDFVLKCSADWYFIEFLKVFEWWSAGLDVQNAVRCCGFHRKCVLTSSKEQGMQRLQVAMQPAMTFCHSSYDILSFHLWHSVIPAMTFCHSSYDILSFRFEGVLLLLL